MCLKWLNGGEPISKTDISGSNLNLETNFSLSIIKRTTVRFINMFQNAQCEKPIFQELISRVLLEIETRGQVFCIVLRPVTIVIAIGTFGLLYLFFNTG